MSIELLIAFLVLVSVKSYTKYPGCGCTFRNEITLTSPYLSESECESQCSSDPSCVSFEWWEYHPNHQSNYCQLSSSCSFNNDAQTRVQVDENYENINLYIKDPEFILYEDKGCSGGNDVKYYDMDLDECRSKCMTSTDVKCISFEWYPYAPWGNNICILSETCNEKLIGDYDGTGQEYKLYLYVKNTLSTKWPGCGCTGRNEIIPTSRSISESQCSSECLADLSCISFEWYEYHPVFKSNYCSLSSSCSFGNDAETKAQVVSNYKDINLYIKNSAFQLYEDYGCDQRNDVTFFHTDLAECRSKCIAGSGLDLPCLSFEWYPYHKTYGENTCTLSESCNQDNMKPYDGTDQGYKLYLYVR